MPHDISDDEINLVAKVLMALDVKSVYMSLCLYTGRKGAAIKAHYQDGDDHACSENISRDACTFEEALRATFQDLRSAQKARQ